MALLEDMGDRLQQQLVGTQGTDIFLGHLPTAPVGAVSMIEGLAREPIRTMGGRSAVHHSLRVLARDVDYASARARLVNVIAALDGYHGTINGHRYLSIFAHSAPVALGEDETGGQQFYCAFAVLSDSL